MNEEILKKMFMDPRNVVHIPTSATKHDLTGTREQWIKINMEYVEQAGLKAWMEELLEVLESEPIEITHEKPE